MGRDDDADPTIAASLPEDVDALRDAIRVRLYPTAALEEAEVAPPARALAEGLSEVVVVDTPESVMVVDADHLEDLGRSDAELFALGRDNVRRFETVELQHADDPVELVVAEGESYFTASWAALLDELVDVPPHGALVVIPSQHALMAHPLRDADAVRAVQVLLGVAHRQFGEAPGPLTPDLYWFHDGGLDLLPTVEQDDGQLGFHPTDAFLDVLNQLV